MSWDRFKISMILIQNLILISVSHGGEIKGASANFNEISASNESCDHILDTRDELEAIEALTQLRKAADSSYKLGYMSEMSKQDIQDAQYRLRNLTDRQKNKMAKALLVAKIAKTQNLIQEKFISQLAINKINGVENNINVSVLPIKISKAELDNAVNQVATRLRPSINLLKKEKITNDTRGGWNFSKANLDPVRLSSSPDLQKALADILSIETIKKLTDVKRREAVFFEDQVILPPQGGGLNKSVVVMPLEKYFSLVDKSVKIFQTEYVRALKASGNSARWGDIFEGSLRSAYGFEHGADGDPLKRTTSRLTFDKTAEAVQQMQRVTFPNLGLPVPVLHQVNTSVQDLFKIHSQNQAKAVGVIDSTEKTLKMLTGVLMGSLYIRAGAPSVGRLGLGLSQASRVALIESGSKAGASIALGSMAFGTLGIAVNSAFESNEFGGKFSCQFLENFGHEGIAHVGVSTLLGSFPVALSGVLALTLPAGMTFPAALSTLKVLNMGALGFVVLPPAGEGLLVSADCFKSFASSAFVAQYGLGHKPTLLERWDKTDFRKVCTSAAVNVLMGSLTVAGFKKAVGEVRGNSPAPTQTSGIVSEISVSEIVKDIPKNIPSRITLSEVQTRQKLVRDRFTQARNNPLLNGMNQNFRMQTKPTVPLPLHTIRGRVGRVVRESYAFMSDSKRWFARMQELESEVAFERSKMENNSIAYEGKVEKLTHDQALENVLKRWESKGAVEPLDISVDVVSGRKSALDFWNKFSSAKSGRGRVVYDSYHADGFHGALTHRLQVHLLIREMLGNPKAFNNMTPGTLLTHFKDPVSKWSYIGDYIIDGEGVPNAASPESMYLIRGFFPLLGPWSFQPTRVYNDVA
ncbi:MAG: LirA/MavJ family T4SS effector [Oligoflexia bacterium]|nr:LirA/MavJ family T4SS effector [Oligoflexia bacterium]